MADGAPQPARRYSAFISYSQADARLARRLHRKLEGYRLPARLRASAGLPSGRLKPFFRDTDDLSAASDLTKAVREALAESDFLIVACSPNAAASQWVAREIELFRHLRGDGRILTALIAGEPETAFPPILLRRRKGHEPLAADVRPGVGGGRLALLKLVAPLAGVRLDDLVHRDAQRRMRQVLAGSVGAVAAIGLVASLAVVTLNARDEAALQAKRANGLGDFMLSDLRKGLEAAGRHDLLKEVNRATLQADADVARMTPEQRIQRAVALQNVAKDAEKAGDLGTARSKADEAHKITAALLAAEPDDPKRLFAHAQSEYWTGFVSSREGNGAAAKAAWEAYARLAHRLVAVDGANVHSRMEEVYSAHDLGILVLRQDGNAVVAERYFRTSLAALASILRQAPDDADAVSERQVDLAWLADTQRIQGRLPEAAALRAQQYQLLEAMLAKSPRSVEVKRQLLFHDLAVARIAAQDGKTARAISLLESGHRQALALAAEDPDNKDFPKQARMFELFKVRLWLDGSNRTRPSLPRIAAVLGDCAPFAPGAGSLEISDFCHTLLARLRLAQGDAGGAAAALVPVRAHLGQQHDVLTARWGLDLAAEARPVQLAQGEAK